MAKTSELKIHIRFKDRALCGVRPRTRKLKYATAEQPPTCQRCIKDASE
jgi:hypothetical protein